METGFRGVMGEKVRQLHAVLLPTGI